MHRSRINGLLIDCKTDDIDAAAQFWIDRVNRHDRVGCEPGCLSG